MSGDQSLFRARLTGVIIDDPADTDAHSGEKGAMVQYIREDTATGIGDGEETGQAMVILPTGIRCPTYAACLHLFGTVDPDTLTLPIDVDKQPRVIVRRDLTDPEAGTVCQAVVISPTFVAIMDTAQGTSTKSIAQDAYADLVFYDGSGNRVTDKLGYFPIDARLPTSIGQGTSVVCELRFVPPLSLPVGYTYAWMMQQASGLSDHTHLIAGSGPNGGGPAFAAFAPSTVAEATALGYTIP